MAKKAAKQPKPAERTVDLRTFTDDFFTTLGATVKATDRRKTGALQVDLPPTLATYFGDQSLTICFQQTTANDSGANGQTTPAPQLIAHGSPLFDKMLAYLENKSAVTHQRLPARHSAGEELMRALRPLNTGIVGLRMQEQTHHLYAFHWHITYRADDKREELYSVLLNEAGERLLNQSDASTTSSTNLTTLLADAEPLSAEPSTKRRPSKSSSHAPSPRATGTSGRRSCAFICVQGCQTAARLRATRSRLSTGLTPARAGSPAPRARWWLRWRAARGCRAASSRGRRRRGGRAP